MIKALIRNLKDDSQLRRLEAMRELKKIADPQTVKLLIKVAKGGARAWWKNFTYEDQQQAFSSLVEIGTYEAIQFIETFFLQKTDQNYENAFDEDGEFVLRFPNARGKIRDELWKIKGSSRAEDVKKNAQDNQAYQDMLTILSKIPKRGTRKRFTQMDTSITQRLVGDKLSYRTGAMDDLVRVATPKAQDLLKGVANGKKRSRKEVFGYDDQVYALESLVRIGSDPAIKFVRHFLTKETRETYIPAYDEDGLGYVFPYSRGEFKQRLMDIKPVIHYEKSQLEDNARKSPAFQKLESILGMINPP